MKAKLLKYLRRKVYSEYQVMKWGDGLWRVCESPKVSISLRSFETKEQAIEEMKLQWHKFAEKYLWEHRTERKQNKYPW